MFKQSLDTYEEVEKLMTTTEFKIEVAEEAVEQTVVHTSGTGLVSGIWTGEHLLQRATGARSSSEASPRPRPGSPHRIRQS